MEQVYITGHKNPDLDSVCSAYAYAVLKNMIDPTKKYIAVRAGHLSESAAKILAAHNITPPPYKRDVFPKVGDVMLKSEEHYEVSDSLSKLAKSYKESNPSVTPVYREGKFAGLISVDDISTWLMNRLNDKNAVLEDPIIGEVMGSQEPPIQISDMFEEAKVSLSSSKRRGLSVYDGEDFAGFVTRRCFLQAPSYNVIMVDHNEPRQSIQGIETANILEIIDHHRLDSLKTSLPIFIDSEPLGSTCTIVYRLFLRNGKKPDEDTARALLTGLVADTLILKSPTTTAIDIETANELAAICKVDINEFGRNMFSHMASLSDRDSKEAILSDFKRYDEKGISIGIGQCEVTTLHDFDNYKDSYLATLEDVRVKGGLDWATVMITDVLSEHSILLTTKYKTTKYLSYDRIDEGIYDMPRVMSRKKQLLPELLYTLHNI